MSFVDNRIVKMVFDNKQFEKGIATTMATLDRFENKLMLKGASAGFDKLQKTINLAASTGLYGLSSAVDEIADNFSVLGIVGTTALVKITSQAIEAGEKLLSSLSIDNIASGWQKFADKTTSVGTIISQGYDLQEVNDQMDRLMWFTDETSYNFTDMVGNISKFTATGKDLEESVTAMEGIALWAASAGQNAGTASRAMFQLSQAMSYGVMRMEDWKSIQNVSMDTDEFREVALQTAVALGKLKKTGEDTYQSLVAKTKAGASEFKKSQFPNALTEGQWFDADVMMAVYNKYGSAAEKIREYAEVNEITASEAIKAIEAENDAIIKAYSEQNNASIDEATEALIKQDAILDPLAIKWFKAGQEARTFNDTIDSIKDAVSTKFMNIFESIFGNYEQATELFTDLAEGLYEIFAEPLNDLKDMMALWHDFGGRSYFIEGLKNAWEGLLSVVDPITEAFDNIFPNEMNYDRLVRMTFEFKEFMGTLKLSEEATENVKRTFQGVFSIFDLLGQAVSAVARTIGDFMPKINDLAGGFLDATGSIGDFFTDMAAAAKENDFFYNKIQELITFLTPAFETVRDALSKVVTKFEELTGIDLHIPTFKEAADAFSALNDKLKALDPTLQTIVSLLGKAKDAAFGFFSTLFATKEDGVEHKFGILEKIGNIFSNLWKIIKPLGSQIKNAISTILDSINRGIEKIGAGPAIGAALFGGAFTYIFELIDDFVWEMKTKLSPVRSIKKTIGMIGDSLVETFTKVQDNLQAGVLIEIAAAIGILAASLLALAGIENVENALTALGGIMGELVIFIGILRLMDEVTNDYLSDSSLSDIAGPLIKIAAAIYILGQAVKALKDLQPDEMGRSLGTIAILLLELGAYAAAMEKYSGGVGNASRGMIKMSVAILVLSAACKVFSTMSWPEIFSGLIGVGVLLAELSLFAESLGNVKHIISSGLAMIAIAAALTVLAGVLFVMGTFFDTMGSGLGALAVLLVELALATNMISLTGAAGILALAAALLLLTPALIAFGIAASGGVIDKALVALAEALLVLAVAAAGFGAASSVFIMGAAALGAFSLAVILAGAALAAFGIGLTVFITSMVAAGVVIESSSGIMAKALETAVVLIIDAIKGMLTAAVSLIPFFVELGLKLIDGLLTGVANHLPSIIQSGATIILAVLVGINQYLPAILQAGIDLMITFINGMANGIRDNQDAILGAVGNLVSSLIELVITGVQGLVRQIPGVGEELANKLEGLKDGVRNTLAPEDFEDIAKNAAESMTHEFEAESGEIYEVGGMTGEKFGEGLGESTDAVEAGAQSLTDTLNNSLGSSDVLSMISDTGGTDIQEWLNGAGLKTDDIETTMKNLAGIATTNLGNDDGKYTTAGDNGILGFISAFGNHDSEVQAAAKRIGDLTLASLKESLQEASPSKATKKIGINAGKGYIIGLNDTNDEVADAAGKLGKTTKDSLKDSIDAQVGILDYADGAVGAFMNHWALMQDNMSDTDAFQVSKDAIELLALQMYAASDASEEAVKDSEENATAVENILNGIKKTYTDMRNSVIQTMDSQTDMLSMFDFGEAVRPEEMLENMESNLRAIDTYYQSIETLTERGIDDGLLRHLEELGPKGAAQMRSFIQMTDEQLEKANQMWQEKGEKMQHAADHVIGALAYSGVQSAGGFVEGLNPETGEIAAQTYIEAALNKMRETVGVNLQNFEAVGGEVADSVAKGIEKSTNTDNATDKAASKMSSDVVGTVDEGIKKEDGATIGYNLCAGIAEGIRNGTEIACTAAEEMARSLIERTMNALGEHSPSKVFAQIGYYADAGLAGGITKYGTVVREAASDMAVGSANEITGVFGRIADMIDGTIDLDPTIRPVLDLTNLQYGASQIGGLLGLNDPYALNATASLSGIQNDATLISGLTSSLKTAIDGMKSDSEIPPVTINIYATENQDAEEIANYTAWKLNHDVFKRRAVHGGV